MVPSSWLMPFTLAREGERGHAVYRQGKSLGERLRGELQRQVA